MIYKHQCKSYVAFFTSLNFSEKSLDLLKEWDGGDRVRIFKADLQEEGSFDKAVMGCSGLFHVAASMQFDVPVEENVGSVLLHYFR